MGCVCDCLLDCVCVHFLLQCVPEAVCGVCVRVCVRLCVYPLLQCVPEAVCGVCVVCVRECVCKFPTAVCS